MKLLIANYEYPPLGGGAGVCTRYHAEGLAALGHEVTVITAWFPGEEKRSLSGRLRIIRVASKRKFIHKSTPPEMYSWVRESRKCFAAELSQETWDLCLTNFAIPGGLFAETLRRKYSIPYVIVSHGQDIPWFFPGQLLLYHMIFYFRIASLLRHSIANIMLTRHMQDAAGKLLPPDLRSRNHIIPNGCDTALFTPDYSRRSAGFSILFTGRLRGQKDPMCFLKAMRILNEKGIEFSATILGDGPLRGKMEARIRKYGLQQRVSITGWVNKERMLEAYRSSSVMVSVSKDEGMSIAILEALSAGLYVIATPASGNPEMIRPGINGELIPFSDPERLAQELIRFQQEKFSRGYRIPAEDLENFRQQYDWSGIVAQYDQLIRTLLP
jgi:glycosyltransferase involved in cell wall biosynthesis